MGQISIENKAPDFTLQDLDGQEFRLSENLGKGPVVVNFWATWCIPCREEMKKLNKLYKKYHSRGLEILAISIDDPKTVGRVNSFIRTRRYPFKVLLDVNSEVIRLFEGNTPPYTVLLSSHGIIKLRHLGYRKGDVRILEEKLIPLLPAKPEKPSKKDGQ